MEIKIDVPNGKECFGCQSLIPPTYQSGCYVCGAFDVLVQYKTEYCADMNLQTHIYKCKQCLNAEVKNEHSSN